MEQLKAWREFSPGPVQVLSVEEGSPQLSVLRLDLLNSWASGNKYYKLKFILDYALTQGIHAIISKGGMFSNHLAALAEACSHFNLHLISVIRSHAPDENNPSIKRLRKSGSEIIYLKPEEYISFTNSTAKQLYPDALFIPEGGLSEMGIKGAAEITAEVIGYNPTHIVIAGGTLGTACGIVSSAPSSVKVIIVPAWKGCTDAYFREILNRYEILPVCSWELWPDYHFGGFARFNQELMDFMHSFTKRTSIPLDPIYTAKMMFALEEKIHSGFFNSNDSIIAIHTGGLQGAEGFQYLHHNMD